MSANIRRTTLPLPGRGSKWTSAPAADDARVGQGAAELADDAADRGRLVVAGQDHGDAARRRFGRRETGERLAHMRQRRPQGLGQGRRFERRCGRRRLLGRGGSDALRGALALRHFYSRPAFTPLS